MAGSPGAWATCPANTDADWWAKMVTPALPPLPVYSQTIPPAGIEVVIGPLNVPPSAVLAWASVGQVAAVVDAGAVVAGAVVVAGAAVVVLIEAAVVAGDLAIEVVVELLLDEPQAASNTPTVKAPAMKRVRLAMVTTIGPGILINKDFALEELHVPRSVTGVFGHCGIPTDDRAKDQVH